MLIMLVQNCLSTLSVVHNCAAHGCAVTRTRHVIQERRVTALLENELNHSLQPDDLLLNLAQLHSARLVQPFRPPQRYPDMPIGTLILHSIRNRHIIEGTEASVPSGPGVDPPAIHPALNGSPSVTHGHPATLSEATRQPVNLDTEPDAPQPGSLRHSPRPPDHELTVNQPTALANEEVPEPAIRVGRKRPRAPAPSAKEYEAELGPQRTRRHRGQ